MLVVVLCELSAVIVPRIRNEQMRIDALNLAARLGILSETSLFSRLLKFDLEESSIPRREPCTVTGFSRISFSVTFLILWCSESSSSNSNTHLLICLLIETYNTEEHSVKHTIESFCSVTIASTIWDVESSGNPPTKADNFRGLLCLYNILRTAVSSGFIRRLFRVFIEIYIYWHSCHWSWNSWQSSFFNLTTKQTNMTTW